MSAISFGRVETSALNRSIEEAVGPRVSSSELRSSGSWPVAVDEYTMVQLADRVIELAEGSSRVEFRLLPEDDPRRRRPDIGLAKGALGWSPSICLDDGLRATIACFRELLQEG